MRFTRRGAVVGFAASVASSTSFAKPTDDNWEEDFAKFVNDGLVSTKAPGTSVAVVRKDRLVFSRGYGLADIKSNRPVTPDTIFHIASVSKTVTALGLMMLWEKGDFMLDESIVKYLDFSVVHPRFPETPITFRHLFTHTSGISDKGYTNARFLVKGDPTLPLRDFLLGYLTPGGQWYDSEISYSNTKPGDVWSYSNVAVALLGYLAGRVSSGDLASQTKRSLFRPLGMSRTAWKLSELKERDVASPYRVADDKVQEVPTVGYPDWPAGLLRTTANDFAQFLKILTNQGRVGSAQFVAPATLQTILTPSLVRPTPSDNIIKQGLVWVLRDTPNGLRAGHSGQDPGSNTRVSFEPQNGIGAIVFANAAGNRAIVPFQQEIIERLLDKGRSS